MLLVIKVEGFGLMAMEVPTSVLLNIMSFPKTQPMDETLKT
jgi:hypothetical protein